VFLAAVVPRRIICRHTVSEPTAEVFILSLLVSRGERVGKARIAMLYEHAFVRIRDTNSVINLSLGDPDLK
jgi:hypothetical protein